MLDVLFFCAILSERFCLWVLLTCFADWFVCVPMCAHSCVRVCVWLHVHQCRERLACISVSFSVCIDSGLRGKTLHIPLPCPCFLIGTAHTRTHCLFKVGVCLCVCVLVGRGFFFLHFTVSWQPFKLVNCSIKYELTSCFYNKVDETMWLEGTYEWSSILVTVTLRGETCFSFTTMEYTPV